MSATEKMLKSSKVHEEVTREQLKFILLLSFYTNIKNDPTEKVNSLLMNLLYRCPAGAMQIQRRFSPLDLSMWLSSGAVLCLLFAWDSVRTSGGFKSDLHEREQEKSSFPRCPD